MFTKEIPRNQWKSFFNDFSKEFQGWTINLEVLDPEIGAQLEAHELPLEGVFADLKSDGLDRISILVGDAYQDHVTHTVIKPTHVRVEEAGRGASEILQIETAGGATTLLSFCPWKV